MPYATAKIKELIGLSFLAIFLVPIMQSVLTSQNVTGLPATVLTFLPSLVVVVVIIHVLDTGL